MLIDIFKHSGSYVKESTCNGGDPGSVLSPGEDNG